MRQLAKIFLFTMFALLLGSCGEGDDGLTYYSLELLVSHPLGQDPDEPLPSYLIQFAVPSAKCDELLLVPKPSMERLDVEGSAINLETPLEPDEIGSTSDIQSIQQQTRSHLEAMTVGEDYARPSPEGAADLQDRYDKILATEKSKRTVLVFSENLDLIEFFGKKVYHRLDSVRFAIAQLVCEEDITSVKVLLNPVTTHGQFKGVNVPTVGKPIFATTTEEVNDFQEKIEHEGGSWEELYEKAGQFILGEDEHAYGHPSAYCYVICAAEKAIETNMTQVMFDRMSTDCPGKALSHDICRLKVGHEAFWDAVRGALLEKNSEKLEGLEEGLFKRWMNHLNRKGK